MFPVDDFFPDIKSYVRKYSPCDFHVIFTQIKPTCHHDNSAECQIAAITPSLGVVRGQNYFSSPKQQLLMGTCMHVQENVGYT